METYVLLLNVSVSRYERALWWCSASSLDHSDRSPTGSQRTCEGVIVAARGPHDVEKRLRESLSWGCNLVRVWQKRKKLKL